MWICARASKIGGAVLPQSVAGKQRHHSKIEVTNLLIDLANWSKFYTKIRRKKHNFYLLLIFRFFKLNHEFIFKLQ